MRRVLAFLAVYLFWGGTFLAIRYLVAEMPPLLAIAVRCAGGAALFLAWLLITGRLEATTPAQWRSAIASGLFLFLGCHGLLAWVEQRVSSGEAALLLTSIPLWLVGLDPSINPPRTLGPGQLRRLTEVVGTYAFVNPVVALLLAFLAGDGAISSRDLIAMVLVLAAVVLSREKRSVTGQDKRREPLEAGSRLMSVASRS